MALKIRMVLVSIALWYAAASGGTLTGRVTASGSAEPLAGVNLVLKGTTRGTTTDFRGEFRLPDIPPGEHTLVLSLIGYIRQEVIVRVRDEDVTFVTFGMIETPVQTEQVVVTASKHEQSLSEVPLSVSVLDAAEMRARNSLTIDDALRYVPGVNMTGQQVNIRGSSGYSLGAGSRVLMLLDGVPLLAGDTGELLFELIPVGQISRIEVVKGASSALYGSNALGGVINIITRPITERPEIFFRTYGGVYNDPAYAEWKWSGKTRYQNGQSFGVARKFGDVGFSLFGGRHLDDGYRRNDWRLRYNLNLKARMDFSSSTALTVNAGLLDQKGGQFLYWKSLDSALIPLRGHERDEISSRRFFVNSLFNTAVSEHVLITGKALWTHNVWGYLETGNAQKTESITDGFRFEASGTLHAGAGHTVTFGVDANADFIGGEMFATRTIGGGAAYLQDEWSLTGDLILTLGARSDFQTVGLTGEGFQLNPKAGITYTPWGGTTLRASFGRGFRVPSVFEAFIAAGGGFVKGVPNPDLKPERSTSYEAGVAQVLGETGSIDIAFFRSDFDNLIEPGLLVSGQNLEVQWRNVTSARVQGMETTLSLGFFGGDLFWSLGYTYVYPEDRSKHDLLRYRPRHLLQTHAVARMGWLSVGADFRYASRVDRIDDELVQTGTVPDGDQRTAIYVTDARVSADLVFSGVTLVTTLNVRNIFQHNYVELIANIMPPRTYVFSLEVRM